MVFSQILTSVANMRQKENFCFLYVIKHCPKDIYRTIMNKVLHKHLYNRTICPLSLLIIGNFQIWIFENIVNKTFTWEIFRVKEKMWSEKKDIENTRIHNHLIDPLQHLVAEGGSWRELADKKQRKHNEL